MPRRPNDSKLPHSDAAPTRFEPKRGTQLNLSLTGQEKQMIRNGAAALGWSMTVFLLTACSRFLATDYRFRSGERPLPTFRDENGLLWTPASPEDMERVLTWIADKELKERAARDVKIAADILDPTVYLRPGQAFSLAQGGVPKNAGMLPPDHGRWGMAARTAPSELPTLPAPIVLPPVPPRAPIMPIAAPPDALSTQSRQQILSGAMPAPIPPAYLPLPAQPLPLSQSAPLQIPQPTTVAPLAPQPSMLGKLPFHETVLPSSALPVVPPGTPPGTFLPMPVAYDRDGEDF